MNLLTKSNQFLGEIIIYLKFVANVLFHNIHTLLHPQYLPSSELISSMVIERRRMN
jgi:hypothetical protein